MKVVIAGFLLIVASCGAPKPPTPAPAHLELSIEPTGELKVGTHARLKARITNRGSQAVDTVVCLDHSDVGWRYPIMRARWTGPDGRKIMTGFGGGCGNSDPVMDKYIVRLAPGESVDPFEASPYGNCTRVAYLRETGRHSVRLVVDYSAADSNEWDGTAERDYFGHEAVRKMLASVPRVKLEANVEFVVSN